MMPAERSTLNAALAYAAAGWPVLPVVPAGKEPLTRHGVHDATCGPAAIRRWWRRWPDANVGVATGKRSRLVVVDIDGLPGYRSLRTLPSRGFPIPRTVKAFTGGGGSHLYYRRPGGVVVPNTAGRLPNVPGPLHGIDLRGDGGYVVVPPSVHASGCRYWWYDGPPAPMALLPAWLWPRPPDPRLPPAGARRPGGASPYGAAALAHEVEFVRRLAVGCRNDGLNRAAFALGRLVAGGELAHDEVYDQLLAAALAVGLPEREARRTIDSGLGAGAATPRSAPRPAVTCLRPPSP